MSEGLARARRRRPALPAIALDIVCFCHGIERYTILEAIASGADSIEKIQETIGATTGPCGGSCTPCVQSMIDHAKSPANPAEPCGPRTCRGKSCGSSDQGAGSTESTDDSSQSDPDRRR